MMKEYPKVLIITDAAWRDDNNIGNTFSNIFQNWPIEKIASIYARPELPQTKQCNNFFQISEIRLLKSIFSKRVNTGMRVSCEGESKLTNKDLKTGKKMYDFFIIFRFNVFLIFREFIWLITRWKNKDLEKFISDFDPDIVFSLCKDSVYLNELIRFTNNLTNSKSVLYFVDDVYNNSKFSISPFYHLFKKMTKREINKTMLSTDKVFVISSEMKQEYDVLFNIESEVLTKGVDVSKLPNKYLNDEINVDTDKFKKILYAGNLYAGRWDSLVKLSTEIERNNLPFCIYIYSAAKLSIKMKKDLTKLDRLIFMGYISPNNLIEKQKSYDALLHVESLKNSKYLESRLSFSTKIVDYLVVPIPLIAVGNSALSSISYLEKHDCAIVINDISKTKHKLLELLSGVSTEKLANNARQTLYNNHSSLDNVEKIKNVMKLGVNR